jgi:PAS domain S-box-containing protein
MVVGTPARRSRIRQVLRGLSIRRKIVLVTLLVSLTALLLASGVVVGGGWLISRETLVRDLSAQAEVLSDNCGAALTFDDRKDAERLLSAFHAMPHVKVAGIYRQDGSLLAAYRQNPQVEIPLPPPIRQGHRYLPTRLEVARPAVLDGQVVGTVFLRADLTPVYSFLRILLLTLGAAFVLAIAATSLLASWLQRYVSSPVIRLAEVARRISSEKDFSIRASHDTDDEIGVLTDAFNQTLEAVNQSHRALVASENNYRAIFNGVSDAIFIHDASSGEIVDVNEAMAVMFGYTREEALGLTVGQLSSGESPYTQNRALDHLHGTAHGGTPVFEWRSRRKSGELFWSEVALRRVELGERSRIIAVVRDIDERKQMEKQLQQAQKMEAIGTLAGGIAHDFNNLLQAMLGNTELALTSGPMSDEAVQCLENIDKAGQRASDLVRQILSLSRQSDAEMKSLQPGSILKEALRLLRSSIPKSITFKEAIASKSAVRADPTQLHQIVMNLCTNAYHAMQMGGGVLSIALDDVELDDSAELVQAIGGLSRGHYVRLTVADTGHGMSPEVQKRIFDPYFTTKDKTKGTGLGLAVVAGIVKKMKGTITVSSQPGAGSVFTVYLPVETLEARETPVLTSSLSGGNERVLVVDDEPSVATLCGTILERLGYTARVVTDPLIALEIFRSGAGNFDILVTDMSMPGRSGIELAREIKAIRPELPVVLTSGFSEELISDEPQTPFIDAMVRKPYSQADLAAAIRTLLDATQTSVTPARGMR